MKVLLFILFAMSVLFSDLASAEMLGRLFTTPEQRAALDAVRYQKEVADVEIDLEPDIEEEAKPGEDARNLAPIRLKGVVYRKDGNSAVWINESSTLRGDLALEGMEISVDDASSGRVEVILPESDRRIKLRVGETYLPAGGEKVDLLPSAQ